MVYAAGWSTQRGGLRSGVVYAAGWSTHMDDLSAFSTEDGLFKWVGLGPLFQMG